MVPCWGRDRRPFRVPRVNTPVFEVIAGADLIRLDYRGSEGMIRQPSPISWRCSVLVERHGWRRPPPSLLRKGIPPKVIRMLKSGRLGSNAGALRNLWPDRVGAERRYKLLLRNRVQIRLREGTDNVESEKKLLDPKLAPEAPLVHEVSEGHDIHIPGGRTAIRRRVWIPLGLQRFSRPYKGLEPPQLSSPNPSNSGVRVRQ